MSAIYTFGYEGHTVNEFLDLIDQHDIDLIVDVRERPLSREYPEFNKFPLITALQEHETQYVYVKTLGCTHEMRALKDEDLGTLKYFQCYERHLQKNRDLIRDLAYQTKNMNICILCSEPDPETCHRTLVADYLQIENFDLALTHLR